MSQPNRTVAAVTPASLSSSTQHSRVSGVAKAALPPQQHPSAEPEMRKWHEERNLYFLGTTDPKKVEYWGK